MFKQVCELSLTKVNCPIQLRNIRTKEIYLKIACSRKAEAIEIINHEREQPANLRQRNLLHHDLN